MGLGSREPAGVRGGGQHSLNLPLVAAGNKTTILWPMGIPHGPTVIRSYYKVEILTDNPSTKSVCCIRMPVSNPMIKFAVSQQGRRSLVFA